ncbi:hypothetical protein [Mycobacterium lentiflavum]|uniref:hypothetical protein n=1 Tax=Mycobacterium lentiflavum TaxID=141349 RepID=UPI000B85D5EA|nr:hypothetical protein [Mycobacterium lentiflavum]
MVAQEAITERNSSERSVLNVGLDPRVLDAADSADAAFPGVGADQVQAGLEATAAEFAKLGVGFDNCLVDRSEGAEEQLRDALSKKRYDVIVFGGGVRLDPAMTPLFEKLVNVARIGAPDTALSFNTGPDTTVAAALRWIADLRPGDALTPVADPQ